jgi:hypothetical protein
MYIPGSVSFNFFYEPLIYLKGNDSLFSPWYSLPEELLKKNYIYLSNSSYAPLWDRVEIIGKGFILKNVFLLNGKYLFFFDEPEEKGNFLKVFNSSYFLNGELTVFERFNFGINDILSLISTAQNKNILKCLLNIKPNYKKDLAPLYFKQNFNVF